MTVPILVWNVDLEESMCLVMKCNTVTKVSRLYELSSYIPDLTNKTHLENVNLFRKYANEYCEELV